MAKFPPPEPGDHIGMYLMRHILPEGVDWMPTDEATKRHDDIMQAYDEHKRAEKSMASTPVSKPMPVSGRHTGLGNQKKPEGWESPPPLPAPGTPEFEAWASQPQRDTSGVNSGMVGHTHKPREASEPDTNPHRINLDTTGAEVDADVAAMHAAHADIANDEQFAAHKPEPAKTKLGGGEIDPKGIADFQAKLIADRKSRGVPEQGDFAQRKSAWEAENGAADTSEESANAMLKAHRSAADAKPTAKAAKAGTKPPVTKATPKATPAPAETPAASKPVSVPVADEVIKAPAAKSAAPATPATGKLTRIGGNFAPRSTPTSMMYPTNEAGTKFKTVKAAASTPDAPAAPAEKPSRFVSPPESPAETTADLKPKPAPVAPASTRPSPTPPASSPRASAPAASKVIGGGNVPTPARPTASTSSPAPAKESAPSMPPATPAATPAEGKARAPRSSKSIGEGWGDGAVHHHVHNYYGGQHFGDSYQNTGSGIQNIGGSISIGQSGGSVGGGTTGSSGGGRGGAGSTRRTPTQTAPRQYGHASPGQFALHTLMNSTVNGKSLNDHVFHATGEHFEQHDSSGARIGDVHSDAHKARNVRGHEAMHGAADSYHHELRQQRQASRGVPNLGQQFTP
jgi:hypothetical protein